MTRISQPSKAEIERLSRLAPGYPLTTRELTWSAQEYGFGQEMVDFLMQFPFDRTFTNEEEFTSEAMDLELLESEEMEMPKERLRSPQD